MERAGRRLGARRRRARATALPIVLVLVAWLAFPSAALAQERGPAVTPPAEEPALEPPQRPTLSEEEAYISGRAGWVFAPNVDLLGEIEADVPWVVGPRREFFGSVRTRTVMLRPENEWAFRVTELDYSLEAGLRVPIGESVRLSLSAGQDGVENVDRPGRRAFRFGVIGLESAGFRRHVSLSPLEWQFAAGPVFDRHAIDADGFAFGALRYANADHAITWGFDARARSLFHGRDAGTELEAGPFVALRWPAGREAELFLHYLSSDYPNSPKVNAVYAGLHLARTGGPLLSSLPSPYGHTSDSYVPVPWIDDPGMHGLFLAGAGEGRRAARFKTFFSSPPLFMSTARVIADVDMDVLTAEETGDLYYLVHVGVQSLCLIDWTCGAYWYHRSNHELASPGHGVRSDNVLEAGIETLGWDRPVELSGEDVGMRIEARVRAGWVMQTSFTPREWHAVLGLRWDLPWGNPSLIPFVGAEAESGDVHRRIFAVGARTGSGLELRFERRADSQFYATESRVWLWMIGGRF